jgi:hypothetical protein
VIRVERLADGSFQAVTEVVVGIEAREVRVPLGRSAREVDPGGLRNTPVVVLTAEALAPLVTTGSIRAGGADVGAVDIGSGPMGAGALHAARTSEVLLIVVRPEAACDALVTARALDGRPLPVVPFGDPAAAHRMLEGCWVDLDVAIPSVEAERDGLRTIAENLGLFTSHHVVEVDPRAGLEGRDPAGSTLDELTAAATGVLAGRIASGNRRWR